MDTKDISKKYEPIYDKVIEVTTEISEFCDRLLLEGNLLYKTEQIVKKLESAQSELHDIAHELEEHLAWDKNEECNEECKEFCPECGTPLEFAYERENGEKVYYCPEGDEHYIFENKGEYRYATCLYDGKRFCVGVAK